MRVRLHALDDVPAQSISVDEIVNRPERVIRIVADPGRANHGETEQREPTTRERAGRMGRLDASRGHVEQHAPQRTGEAKMPRARRTGAIARASARCVYR